MHINKIEDLIDKIFDDFYINIILKNNIFSKIRIESNFIKFQKDINDIVNTYIETIPDGYILDIANKGEGYNTIIDTLKRYIMLYIFLNIGIFYSGKTDIFINNLIEFSRNQSGYSLSIDNFFNSESNSMIIKLYYICKNIITLVSKNKFNIESINREPYAEDTIKFIETLGTQIVEASFNLKKLNNNVDEQVHNIIKTLLIINVYIANDKKILYSMIESSEFAQNEFMFIDIIEPITELINFTSIENILSKEEIDSGLAYDVWDYLEQVNIESKNILSNDEKINILINSGNLIPILDDFLLYHMDNEKYDKTIQSAKKNKEDTKIKYIIGKIDTVTELYSENTKKNNNIQSLIIKNFSNIFYPRKAVLRNNIEDVKIINKIINQGKISTELNEFFNALSYYNKYPYINFKDFEKFGFSNYFNKTVTSVRAVNFDTKSEFKQLSLNTKLQLRVGSKNSMGNIVGFMLPTNKKSIQCIKLSEVIDIRSLSKKDKNGFNLFLQFFKNSVIYNEAHNSSVYWIFDLNLDSSDIVSGNRETVTINSQENIKIMMGKLYDKIVEDIQVRIIEIIEKHKNVSLQKIENLVKKIENTTLKSRLPNNIYNNIDEYICNNKLKRIEDINQNEHLESDILYGLEGTMITLPTYVKPEIKKLNKLIINLSKVDESGEVIELEENNGVCQHNITWENISIIRMKDNKEYIKRLYDFLKQYVVENTHGEYVCKSCGFCLDISKVVDDGAFNENGSFITFSMPVKSLLEDIPEYSKYQFTIKIMEKNIEKIASSVGISQFVGSTISIKSRRQEIIKNVIDMVSQNNIFMSINFKKRNETKYDMYGIAKNQSTIFNFEMDNSIYQTSSQDKDQEQYKMIKRNNISIYILIYLIFELNESHISFFNTDKKSLCDIIVFDKIYNTLFSGLKIKKNNTNDTYDIIKYKILCYLIYMISCRIAKHRLWYIPMTSETNIIKMIPIIQRRIIHTTVDIINSILENSYNENASYIFEVFRIKFHTKMNTIFNNNNYYKLLLEQSNFTYATARQRSHLTLVPDDKLPPFIYNPIKWRIVIPQRYFPSYLKHTKIKIEGISNITNCSTGNFHNWTTNGNTFKCKLCNLKINELIYNVKDSKEILEKYKNLELNLLAQKYCLIDKDFHQYVFNPKTKINICNKCKNTNNHIYTNTELQVIKKIVFNTDRYDNFIKDTKLFNDVIEKDNQYIKKVIETTKNHMTLNKNKDYIDTFIDKLKSLVGEVLKGSNVIYLKNNEYLIDHDHNGHDLGGDNIIITDDTTINIKQNHPFFKKDVIYYTDKRGSRIDVYYDATTKYLIGYKELARDYVDIKNTTKQIKINQSLYNKLKILGYSTEYINTQNYSLYNKHDKYNHILKDICSNRLENLKRTILEFQRVFNNILNKRNVSKNKKNEKDTSMQHYFSDKLNIIIRKYEDNFNNIKTSDKNGKGKLFKHWKGMTRGIFINDFKDIYFSEDISYINVNEINRYDEHSNIMLYYIIEQFSNLLDYNNNNFNKINIANFIIEFINAIYNRYNHDYVYLNTDINKFIYSLTSKGYLKTDLQAQTDGIYEESIDSDIEPTEEEIEYNMDVKESLDAIDVDMSMEDIDENGASEYDRLMEYNE